MNTIEEQIRAIADEAVAQTEPILRPRHNTEVVVGTDGEPIDIDTRRATGKRARLLGVAAAVLIVGLVGALVVATNRGATPIPADEPGGPWVTGLLQRVPGQAAGFGDLRISGADLVALETLTGIERPDASNNLGEPSDSADEWSTLASGDVGADPSEYGVVVPRSQLFTEALSDPESFRDEVPFSPLDVGRYVTIEMDGPTRTLDEFTLVSGADAVADAVDDDGYLLIGTGELGERNVADRTALRPIGEPMQLGFDAASATVAVERGGDLVPGWLSGTGDSLSDRSPDVAAVAEQLDRIDGLTSFAITVEDFTADSFAEESFAAVGTSTVDRPFSTFAQGWSGIGESARLVLVYAFADEHEAADAVPSIEATFAPDNVVPTFDSGNVVLRPVAEDRLTMGRLLDVESIETIGRTVVVIGSLPDHNEWSGAVRYLAPYLSHE